MRDIQSEQDTRAVPLQKVGVKGVHYPVTVLDKNAKQQQTTATVDLYVNLPHNYKGTHMSRFIEVFHKYHEDISMHHFLEMLEEMRIKLSAQKAFGRVEFPYFIEKKAPVSGAAGIMQYKCSYEGEVSEDDGKKFYVSIQVPIAIDFFIKTVSKPFSKSCFLTVFFSSALIFELMIFSFFSSSGRTVIEI